jgi:hypothetical protein
MTTIIPTPPFIVTFGSTHSRYSHIKIRIIKKVTYYSIFGVVTSHRQGVINMPYINKTNDFLFYYLIISHRTRSFTLTKKHLIFATKLGNDMLN